MATLVVARSAIAPTKKNVTNQKIKRTIPKITKFAENVGGRLAMMGILSAFVFNV